MFMILYIGFTVFVISSRDVYNVDETIILVKHSMKNKEIINIYETN